MHATRALISASGGVDSGHIVRHGKVVGFEWSYSPFFIGDRHMHHCRLSRARTHGETPTIRIVLVHTRLHGYVLWRGNFSPVHSQIVSRPT